jgi:hypothetical protein
LRSTPTFSLNFGNFPNLFVGELDWQSRVCGLIGVNRTTMAGSEFADWRPIFMNHASASKNVSFFRVLKLASIFTSWGAMTKYKSFCDPIFDS